MKILIDIGHPGHVHYFRNLYLKLKANKHDIIITARDKEVSFELLHYYNMPFISRGNGKKSLTGKFLYLFYATFIIIQSGYKFKPELIISFASPYASIASFFLRCNNIVLDDTEVGRLERYIYKLFADLIITPKAFKKNLGPRHYPFDGFMELSYLLPAYFYPDKQVLNDLKILNEEKYIVIRFVSWQASHDLNQRGLSLEQKQEIISHCRKFAKVFISSEEKLPESLEKYRLKIHPYQLHDALFFAEMYIGEGATTASESCLMGTPAIYVNTISAGTIEEQEKSGLLFNYRSFSGVMDQIDNIMQQRGKELFVTNATKLKNEKIDLTAFLTWLIEEYPSSQIALFKDPDYQYRFKNSYLEKEYLKA